MNRTHLEKMLARLDERLPAMNRDHPEEAEFWPAFAGEADVIQDAAGAADFDWVSQQIDALLMKHGRPPAGDSPPKES